MHGSNSENAGYGWRAVVPATSANLGCAFDCGGLALKIYLKALFVPSATADLSLEYRGKTPERFPLDGSNLVLHALRFAAEKLSAPAPTGHVLVESEIPISVGLGSSAAAVIAGLLLGAQYGGQSQTAQNRRDSGALVPPSQIAQNRRDSGALVPPSQIAQNRRDSGALVSGNVAPEQILRWAEEIEGHIDNAAAAYYGGLVLALSNNVEQVTALKTNFPESIRLVIVTPAVTVPTHEARQALPKSYDRAEVLHTLQRTSLLAATCFSGRFDLFPALFDDRLHQPYRQKLVPGIERCLRLQRPGLMGVAISGSGSSVIAFAEQDEVAIAEELQKIFAEEGLQSEALFTAADNNGAGVTRELVPLVERLGGVLQKLGRAE